MNPSSPQVPNLSFKAFKDTPCQSLPLKEIVEIIYGKSLSKKQLSSVPIKSHPYPVIAGGLRPLGYYHQYNSDQPAITIIRKGSVGLCLYHEDKMWYSDGAYLIKIKHNNTVSINLLYLYYLLKAKEPQIQQLKTGTSVPGIQKPTLFNFKITLTPHLEEQNQIATFLSLLEQQIKLENEILTLYQTQQKYYLHRLITAQLKFKAFKDTPWQEVILQDILEERKERSTVLNQYPIASVTIKEGLILQNIHFKKRIASQNDIGYKIVYPQDIAINPAAITIGSIGLNQISTPLLVSPIYISLRINNDNNHFFIFKMLKNDHSIKRYQNIINLGVRENFDIKAFYRLKFYLPSTAEQNKIADFLSLLEQQIKLENDLLTLYQTQKKYYLHQMFV